MKSPGLLPYFSNLWSIRVPVIAGVLLASSGCGPDHTTTFDQGGTQGSDLGQELFVESASEFGLDFEYVNGATGNLNFYEIMGPGCALFDFDNDGDLDAYLVQGHLLDPDYDPERALGENGLSAVPHDRLYRNDLQALPDGSTRPGFTDVTRSSGINGVEYGMGVATGDIDNDGWTDLYVTNVGNNRLWRNNGDGTFTDITSTSGTDELEWSTSASFVDIDSDGWLDLYVTNYLHYGYFNHRPCKHPSSAPEYCGPKTYPAVADRLFRNNGNGTFTDISDVTGISKQAAPGLGVVSGDFNDDGRPDFYVANDGFDNMLWVNRGGGAFADEALISGCAVNWTGERGASMGVDAGDFDGDGDLDLIVGHMDGETNTLYINLGNGLFEDRSRSAGLAQASRRHTTYAALWFDADNDSWLDLFVSNGAMQIFNEWTQHGGTDPLREPNQLYRNLGNGTFADISTAAGRDFDISEVSRGGAVGDIDNDGDLDVLVTNNDGPTRLLINTTQVDRRWFGFDAVGTVSGRTMLGSLVTITVPDTRQLIRRVATDGSYCSARDPRIVVDVDAVGEQPSVAITWPDGTSEAFTLNTPGTYSKLVQGEGSLVADDNESSRMETPAG